MSGRSTQDKKKKAAHSVDMSADPNHDEPERWRPPPGDECDEATWTTYPVGADVAKDRVKVRMVTHKDSYEIVDFAVVQQTHYKAQWRDVVKVDSAHDYEVHMHRYRRKPLGEEVGAPEQLTPIGCAADVSSGYGDSYGLVMGDWEANKLRWHDG